MDILTCTLPQLPTDEYESTRDVDLLCVDVWRNTGNKELIAYLFIYNNGKTEARFKKSGGWENDYPPFDTYDEARLYLEAMILLGVENE